MKRVWSLVVLCLALAAPAFSQGMPNHRGELVALRGQYPALLTQVQAGELLNRLVWQIRGEGFGLLRKDGGNSCPVVGLPFRVSCDIVLHRPTSTFCDVLGSAPDGPNEPGPSTPSWCAGEPGDMSNFVSPVQPADGGGGGGGDTGGGGAVDLTPRVVALERDITTLRQQLAAANARIDALAARVDALPPPAGVNEDRIKALIASAFANVVVSGSTGRSFGHSHSINVTIQPR
jgi:hypothetical protein